MGPFEEVKQLLEEHKRELDSNIYPKMRQIQKDFNDQWQASMRQLNEANAEINQAIQRLIMPTIEEITAEHGVSGRPAKRLRPALSKDTEDAAPQALAKAPIARNPDGKRFCGNCGESGHRKPTCPKPVKNANLPMGKRGCGNCGKPGHRRTTCPN